MTHLQSLLLIILANIELWFGHGRTWIRSLRLIIQHREPCGPLRAAAYPPVGDQLDAIMKMAHALHEQGISLPPEVMEWVDRCLEVKRRFPKKGS